MGFRAWLEKQAPDFLLTGQRFPIAILFAALTTVVAIGALNGVDGMRDEAWGRAALGFATAAVLAVAGVYFAESRPEARVFGAVLKYGLPIAVAATFQITDTGWFVPYALPAVAVLWLSVSPFTRVERGAPREEVQNRFWWVNFQAFATAVIAAAAFLLVALGLAAIERSLGILFGIETGQVFYNWVLPFAGLFLTPVYWLSTLPRLSAYRAEELQRPDFLPRAFGFLGQFVLVPLLLIYGLILLAYTAQIVVTRNLPQGMIGWMVLGFVVIGAATWLVLHPPFMRTRALVRLFRRWWFWLTLIPLALFFIAVWTRVDAYGLTDERVLLAAGGVWAAVLALVFIVGRGDIRLIPALAGLLLLLVSVGPWNYANLPLAQQTMRLDALLMQPGKGGASFPPDWTPEQVAKAASIMDFLASSPAGEAKLAELLERYGMKSRAVTSASVLEELGYQHPAYAVPVTGIAAQRDSLTQQVDVSATPILLGGLTIYVAGQATVAGLNFEIVANQFRIIGQTAPETDLTEWIVRQPEGALVDPWIDFAIGERKYRYVIDYMTADLAESGQRALTYLGGTLFASAPTPTP
ncbi:MULTISPECIES: DUF4153 domain-containing protein [unclassified Devosia]|uniref:DUF4153 domain-containing protein n=1 Tax=unclassified Devosia TaxID=196773 RepID=UPI000868CD8E|nr:MULTISPECIES: DUF4153 domain-containing protein [unclassified Devosia]MBN9361206.1 DUF4153 domain-containing protein [Devosia sp.]ODS95371.1 MAG: hypothetical protein ABS47_03605 [Devosia sp. SCN 66-27]OJX26305.1 MAG: hypothetical protein BGO83_20585 [Devosia sp. 66-14]